MVRAYWDAYEPKESNVVRWLWRRWVRLAPWEKVFSCLPLWFGLFLLQSSPVMFVELLGLTIALAATLSCRQGYSGYVSKFSDEDEVTLLIERDGLALGEDRGILTASEGWLRFAGQRSNFALRFQDVWSYSYERRSDLFVNGLGPKWHQFRINGDVNQRVYIRSIGDSKPLESTLSSWESSRTNVATGEPIFPPIEPHCDAYRLADLGAIGSFHLLCLLLPVFVWSGRSEFDWIPQLFVGIAILVVGDAFVRFLRTPRKLDDLAHLAREQETQSQ